MIENQRDYQYYLEADRIALGRPEKANLRRTLISAFIAPDYVWQFQKLLRKVEFLKNCNNNNPFMLMKYALYYRKFLNLSLKLGFLIEPNTFGPGLSISHPACLLVNEGARIGANCRIHPLVTIGTQPGYSDRAARMGDNIYIGPGARIYGPVEIADNIVIGANAVVTRSFTEPGITIAGAPAKKISDKGSEGLIIKATEILNNTRTVRRLVEH
jgi:serine O-acetyltransferase